MFTLTYAATLSAVQQHDRVSTTPTQSTRTHDLRFLDLQEKCLLLRAGHLLLD